MPLKHTIIYMMLVSCCLTACSQNNSTALLYEDAGYDFPYQLAAPDQSWKLPKILVEISGLGFVDNHRLACVQDEKGVIFIFNMKNGQIEKEIIFGDDGDYEGIDIIENDAWVLKSNGTLYEVAGYMNTAVPQVKKYPTNLSRSNDTEGLAYDPVSNSLLIACKEQPFTEGTVGAGTRAVYSFDLESGLMDNEPFLLINLDSVKHYHNKQTLVRLGAEPFKPSGIAIHPVTGEIFILGSVGKLLLVFSRKGMMLAMVKLSPHIFPQPEGICFSPDGTLYIASEGAGLLGAILKFEPKVK